MDRHRSARVAFGLVALWASIAAVPAFAQDVAAPTAGAGPSSAVKPAKRPRGARHRVARLRARNRDQGEGFSGATNTQGTTTSRGLNAKPATTAVSVPAGTFDPGDGLTFQLNYTSESAGNPLGGLQQGVAYADQILFGVDADLNRIAGIPGGTIHVIGTQRDGRSLARDFIGNSLAPQEIFDGSENTRLTILTYEQKALDDRLDVEVGRLPAQGAFLVSPLYCNFQNVGVCGSPEIVFNDTGFTFFPTSTYGGHVKYFFDDRTFLHVGAFEVQPKTELASDHGVDFSLSGATGVVVPIELGYTTTAANDPFPRNYGIGALIDQSTYNDPVNDSAGGNALLSGLPAQSRFGRTLVYGRFDQTVWRPDSTATRGVQVFGVASGGTSGRQTQDYQLEAGAVMTGPFTDRPFDTAGFVVTDQRYSALGLANVRAARASLGLGSSDVAANEVLLELNYGIQISPSTRLTPNLQYIVDPDQNNEPFRTRPIPNAFVIGAKLSVDLFTLAGLARGPGSL